MEQKSSIFLKIDGKSQDLYTDLKKFFLKLSLWVYSDFVLPIFKWEKNKLKPLSVKRANCLIGKDSYISDVIIYGIKEPQPKIWIIFPILDVLYISKWLAM